MKARTLLILFLGLALCGSATAMPAADAGRYRIALAEAAVLAEVLQGCACSVESEAGAVIITASRATAMRLASDPRVVTVEQLPDSAVPRLEPTTDVANVRADATAA